MAITGVKVHPAIGVARLGNSPSDFFIGPEQLWQPPDPPGGFKDSECRVKRQAARFRVYAYHDNGPPSELTAADATIAWTVELANKKVLTRYPADGSAAQLTIAPGPRTLTGPSQHAAFDDGQITLPGAAIVTVPLGEVRTDTEGRLLVLGGFGNSASPAGKPITYWLDNEGWYDDISDGSVGAHVILGNGDQYDATGAWVLVAPPKFAPALEMPTTLYDRLFDLAATQGWVNLPNPPSYTNDIYPILRRARMIGAVATTSGAHTWADPIYDQMHGAVSLREWIFDNVANPDPARFPGDPTTGDMPRLSSASGDAWSHLTDAQYAILEQWKNDNFVRDWNGPPTPATITPQGLDEAALRACVGAAFYPGIEAGGNPTRPILNAGIYVGTADDPMRFDHAKVSPGDLSAYMALPWQTDFNACSDTWWPVPRPDEVTPQGTTSSVAWDRNLGSVDSATGMIANWSSLGFVVDQSGSYVETEACPVASITLETPHLDFGEVPQGPMGTSRKTALAVLFEVVSQGAAVTLSVAPGGGPSHARLTLPSVSVTVGPTAANAIAPARLWLVYETGVVGEEIGDQLTLANAASGETWLVTVSAGTVAREVAAAALVLDKSGSMADDAGDGLSKHDNLVAAASIFTDVMLEGDSIGLVAFSDSAATLQPLAALGSASDPFDPGRTATKGALAGPGLTPGGSTSIGAGIAAGAGLLAGAGGGVAVKALVVLTDGMENTPPWIADEAANINANTYAVGIGTPENISTVALQTISGNNGGYLLLTGAITTDERFLLQKYFLQILAGVSNAEIVLDPQGTLVPGPTRKIPFQITEADAGLDVILLTPTPRLVEFGLQGPAGSVITPASAYPAISFVDAAGVEFYRMTLPIEYSPSRFDGAGTWNALLRLGDEREQLKRGVPYSLVVHTYSNLSLRATLEQTQYDPGATIAVHATLRESGIPLAGNATVWAEVLRPDLTATVAALDETDAGVFAGSFATTIAGAYRVRVRARGQSSRGYPFTREQTLSAGVWHGGGGAGGGPGDGGGGGGECLCRLLRCLLQDSHLRGEAERRLKALGLDIARVTRCLEECCDSGRRD